MHRRSCTNEHSKMQGNPDPWQMHWRLCMTIPQTLQGTQTLRQPRGTRAHVNNRRSSTAQLYQHKLKSYFGVRARTNTAKFKGTQTPDGCIGTSASKKHRLHGGILTWTYALVSMSVHKNSTDPPGNTKAKQRREIHGHVDNRRRPLTANTADRGVIDLKRPGETTQRWTTTLRIQRNAKRQR